MKNCLKIRFHLMAFLRKLIKRCIAVCVFFVELLIITNKHFKINALNHQQNRNIVSTIAF